VARAAVLVPDRKRSLHRLPRGGRAHEVLRIRTCRHGTRHRRRHHTPGLVSRGTECRRPDRDGFAGPLQIDVGANGQIYVAQDFAGIVTKVLTNGTRKDIVVEQGEVAGVASRGYDVVYTFSGGDEANPVALLKRRASNGTITTIADLGTFEAEHNPDSGMRYGFRNVSSECLAQVPPDFRPYTVIVESHPYAVANAPDGGWYVADAAANDVLHVAPNGDIEVFGVLRPRKSGITAEAAEALGLSDCTIGHTYAFEAVPTDVEVKSTSALIVSLLPGGEDPSLGARGAVIRLAGDGEFANRAAASRARSTLPCGPAARST
jgi:hypothetical protein